mgnify:CR=1 FL=1
MDLTFNPQKSDNEMKMLVVQNTLRMLKERKWLTDKEISKGVDEFKDNINLQNLLLDNLSLKQKNKISIHFVTNKLFFKKLIYTDNIDLDDEKDHVIIILTDKTKQLKIDKKLNRMNNVEIWIDRELYINYAEHILIPKHRLLSDEEKNKFLKEFKLNSIKMKLIDVKDMMARYLNAKLDDVIEILRPNEMSGIHYAWRLVRKKPKKR